MHDDGTPTPDRPPLPAELSYWDELPAPAVVDAVPRRLMALHAHPDDEASKGAGTVARYVAEGVRCTLVTMTGGEEGEVLNPELAGDPDVAARLDAVRMEELAESVRVCGYAATYLLGYRDSGMAETEANGRPDAFVNADRTEALGRLVALVRAERPQVILSYDEHEFYPHPDHVTTYELGVAVFDAAADPDFHVDGMDLGPAWAPSKLYWFHWSMKRIRQLHEEFQRRGWESPFDRWMEMPIEDDDVTTSVDIGDYMEQRRRSLLAHRTQVAPDSFFLRLPDDVLRELHPYEDYTLARDRTGAAPTADDPESDLFAGVDVAAPSR